jgi:hypothetical protein
MGKHTILLVQEEGKKTRCYYDYEEVQSCMMGKLKYKYIGICKLFEKKLKEKYPNKENITYGIKELNNYIDSLGDLSCLV